MKLIIRWKILKMVVLKNNKKYNEKKEKKGKNQET